MNTEDSVRQLVRGTNDQAITIYQRLVELYPTNNLLISPVSFFPAIAMLYAGARGQTGTEIQEVLGYSRPGGDIHSDISKLHRTLNARGIGSDESFGANGNVDEVPVPFRLDIVNAVWGQAGFPFLQNYLTLLDEWYEGGFRQVDYQTDPAAARTEINRWIAEQTDGRIETILPDGSPSPETRMIVTNATYFLANWEDPFDEETTTVHPFTTIDGSRVEIPLMDRFGPINYAETDVAQAVDLPYVGNEVSMLVILPQANQFRTYESKLDVSTLNELIHSLGNRAGTVKLPSFEFATKITLRKALKSLGMSKAFDRNEADFSAIVDIPSNSTENLFIDQVHHNTHIAVDEKGTEAAAVTAVGMALASANMDPFEFIADRSFIFVIRDRPTGAVLFIGRVVNPD